MQSFGEEPVESESGRQANLTTISLIKTMPGHGQV